MFLHCPSACFCFSRRALKSRCCQSLELLIYSFKSFIITFYSSIPFIFSFNYIFFYFFLYSSILLIIPRKSSLCWVGSQGFAPTLWSRDSWTPMWHCWTGTWLERTHWACAPLPGPSHQGNASKTSPIFVADFADLSVLFQCVKSVQIRT